MRHRAKRGHKPFFDADSEIEDGLDEALLGRSPASVRSYGSAAAEAPLREATVKPRNEAQAAYWRALEAPGSPAVVVASGPAGTGKSMLAVYAAWNGLARGAYERVVMTRPIVHVDDSEGLGFMPGDMLQKMQPWTAPLMDALHGIATPQRVRSLLDRGKLELCPLDLMRGRSFENCVIIADEMQNATPKQVLMLLTRLGAGSKLVVTGDPTQHDRPRTVCGLSDLLVRMGAYPGAAELRQDAAVFHFQAQHVERHPIIKHVLHMYEGV